MTERLINLRDWEAQAFSDGRACAIVRVCKPQPSRGWAPESPPVLGSITSPHPNRGKFGVFIRRGLDTEFPESDLLPCPFGAPGDLLLGREAWAPATPYPENAVYRATYEHRNDFRWKSSIHMPRWAIRFRRKVESVRCLRVHELCTGDMWECGMPVSPDVDPVHAYAEQFDRDHGPGAWASNPWVFIARLTK